ncbi:MAG: hypothetical protein KatS3mg057_1663 [Herpetosiphonaceae bacterium]|nr:MAG: hypothetical protein KatS3mg057_1663 [Herpetosiphonaceae bacterium]
MSLLWFRYRCTIQLCAVLGCALLLLGGVVAPAAAAPREIRPEKLAAQGFSSNPDQDSGWVKANVVGGGCRGNGTCDSNVQPGSRDQRARLDASSGGGLPHPAPALATAPPARDDRQSRSGPA